MKKVIFLDVDGVLNNGNWALEMAGRGIRVYRDDLLYEPALAQLRRIVDATGAVIVVSSSWRQTPIAFLHLREWLERFGMTVYGKTPFSGGQRGDEITAWFDQNPGKWRYVILDDDGDMGVHIARLVRTSFDVGLTARDADLCIHMLGPVRRRRLLSRLRRRR